MFKIQDGRNKFFQWDLDRKLIIEDATVSQVHYCNKTGDCSLVCEVYEENSQRVADVPNILLQSDWRINVYAYDKNHTKHNAVFQVVARTKPADYVYTETEIVNYAAIDKRITALEKGGGGGGTADLSNYYNKQEVDDMLANVEVDLTGYATESYVETAISNALSTIGIAEEVAY